MPLKYDISNENFNYFFLEQAANLREAQREKLPSELISKIYRKGYRLETKSTSKLHGMEKLFVLKQLGKNVIIIIEDEKNGMSVEDFFKYKELLKKRKYNDSNSSEILNDCVFVLGNSELVEIANRINRLCVSAAYNYLTKIKSKNYLKPDEHKTGMKFLAKWVNNYESQRKKFIIDNGLNVAEWITLTYLYDGEEKTGSVLYSDKFKGSFNTSVTKIKVSFGTLQNKGFIVKYGNGKGTKLQITALGKSKLNGIFEKSVVKC